MQDGWGETLLCILFMASLLTGNCRSYLEKLNADLFWM